MLGTRCAVLRCVALMIAPLIPAAVVSAQSVPYGPVSVFDGRLTVTGQVDAIAGAKDDIAFFNYTDYEHNALRMLQLRLAGRYRPARWLEFVGDARSEDLETPRTYAAYVRVHPWRARQFDVQAGRIPPAFGSFARRGYALDNPLIGYPLAYQYLTSLRADAVPATADDLLRMRARGWRSSFPVGSGEPSPGVPLVSAFRWDTGVEARWAGGPIETAVSVTNGTLCDPRVGDNNSGKQLAARLAVTPRVGLVVGASAARGAWLSRNVEGLTGARPSQRALGFDAEYSRDHWIVRGEMVWSRWGLPIVLRPSGVREVRALGAWAEGRYRITPRLFAAARVDRLTFSSLAGTVLGGASVPWDAPVTRLETAVGWYLQRNLVARVGVQDNWRDAGRVRERHFVSASISYWF